MTALSAPFGVRPVSHPSGTLRQTEYLNGVASGYDTDIFTGTPVKYDTSGNLVVTAAGADTTVGVFAGCEFSSNGRYFVLPYWPADQTYDAFGPARFYLNDDKGILYEAQADGPVVQTQVGEGINLAAPPSPAGSVFTGASFQQLDNATTGATPATFILRGLAPYEDNAWGDAFTIVRVSISTYQGQVA